MLNPKDLASLPFLKKSPYTGSYKGMRYRIQKEESEDTLILRAFAWKGMFCFDKTPSEDMVSETFPFSDDGLARILNWLNCQYEEES